MLIIPMVFDYYAHPLRALIALIHHGYLTEEAAQSGLCYAWEFQN